MKIDVKHIAKLANLPLTPEEEEKFARQLEETISYVEQLKTVDTKGVEPTAQVTGLENVFREDLVGKSLTQKEALANSKDTQDGFFKVKAILDG